MTLMLSQLFQLFAFLLLGMFARWKIIVDGSFPGGLSRVVVDFFLPCMLFLSVYDNLSLQTLQEERSSFLWGFSQLPCYISALYVFCEETCEGSV